MRRHSIIYSFFIALATTALPAVAQDINKASEEFATFTEIVKNNGYNADAYDALMRGYNEYLLVVQNKPDGSPERKEAQAAMAEKIDKLIKAINFYNGNDQVLLLMAAARTYVDVVAYCPDIEVNQNYHLPLVRLAAINSANVALNSDNSAEAFTKVIPYLRAYIDTGDITPENRMEDAIGMLGYFYFNVKDYPQAYRVLKNGLESYPDNMEMLQTMISTLQHISNKAEEMYTYVSKALTLAPNDVSLIQLQAQTAQKIGKHDVAISCLERLLEASPNNRDYSKNLAYNYAKLGLDVFDKQATTTSKNEKKELATKAQAHLSHAAQLLEALMADCFTEDEKMRYAQALLTMYGYTSESKKMAEMEEVLKKHGRNPIKDEDAISGIFNSGILILPTHNDREISNFGDISNSDVDLVPVTDYKNTNTFVVIIANEDYKEVDRVDFAINDGGKFYEYCTATLGIPEANIKQFRNATFGEMKSGIRFLQSRTQANADANIIYYYAGHGMPAEGTDEAYLLPVDGSPFDITVDISLRELHEQLGTLDCKNAYVFLDACFSGTNRDGHGLLSGARAMVRPPKPVVPKGKVVVFSAATGSETAMPYREHKHGLFTYFLLKKLQETEGLVTIGELADYICTSVEKNSRNINNKDQHPTVKASEGLSEDLWRSYYLVPVGE